MALPVTEQPNQVDDVSAKYDSAVANRDPVAMMDVAKQSYGTPLSTVALKNADLMYKTSKQFNELVNPIEKLGGIATPEGRIELTNKWKSVKNNPQWGDALLMFALGDKQGASNMITGGEVKTRITYDRAGRQLQEQYNALGQIVDVTDMTEQRKLDPREYGQRGGGLRQWENSLGYVVDKKQIEENTKSLIENNKTNDYWKLTIDSLTPKADQALSLSKSIKDLPSDVQAEIYKASSRGQQASSAASTSKSLLQQINQDASFRTDREFNAEFGSKIGLGADPVKWEAASKTFRNLRTNQTKSLGELEQQQNSSNVSSELNNSFTQSQNDLAKFLKTSKLSNGQQEQVLLYNKLLNEMNQEMTMAEMKYGKPAFLTRPSTADITDPVKNGVLMATGVLANKDIMNEYIDYYNKNIKNYGPGEVPRPLEIERAYTTTDLFKNQQGKLAHYYEQIMSMPTQVRSMEEAKPAAKKAVAPPSATSEPKPTKRSLADIEKGLSK